MVELATELVKVHAQSLAKEAFTRAVKLSQKERTLLAEYDRKTAFGISAESAPMNRLFRDISSAARAKHEYVSHNLEPLGTYLNRPESQELLSRFEVLGSQREQHLSKLSEAGKAFQEQRGRKPVWPPKKLDMTLDSGWDRAVKQLSAFEKRYNDFIEPNMDLIDVKITYDYVVKCGILSQGTLPKHG